MKRGAALVALFLASFFAVGFVLPVFLPSKPYSQAEQFALRIDKALDALEEPEFEAFDLALAWPLEIAPYLQYERLTVQPVNPAVVFEPFPGDRHAHIAGYTYCGDEVYLNLRYLNWTSSWYDDISSLVTLVHEIVHTAGGDFCSWDSETAESRTQLGTLEVLAGMANHGNVVAYYALLDELREIAMNTALLEALQSNDLDGYREFREQIFPGDKMRAARFEKSMRYWAGEMITLKQILKKYSAVVFEDLQDGKFKADLPPGDGDQDTVFMDDLMYILENLS